MGACTGIVELFKHLLCVRAHHQFFGFKMQVPMGTCTGQYSRQKFVSCEVVHYWDKPDKPSEQHHSQAPPLWNTKLNMYTWREPGIYSDMNTAKGRMTLIACGCSQRLRTGKRAKLAGKFLLVSSYQRANTIHTECWTQSWLNNEQKVAFLT